MGTLFRSQAGSHGPRPDRADGEGAPAPAPEHGVPGIQDALDAVDRATLDAGEAGTARFGASTVVPRMKYRGVRAPGPAPRR